MNKTAFLKKTPLTVLEQVYFPREDSFLLAKTVKVKKNSIVLDMGCGSGVQTINALQKGAKKVLAVDINKKALENTLLNAKKTGFEKQVLAKKSDLFENINKKFDLIIFNPPYVPTEKKELIDVDGGKNGREVLDRFLDQFPKHLKHPGKCFFLQSSLNGIKKTEKKLEQKNISFKITARQKLFFEELVVFEASKEI